jgi:hypothetical protein
VVFVERCAGNLLEARYFRIVFVENYKPLNRQINFDKYLMFEKTNSVLYKNRAFTTNPRFIYSKTTSYHISYCFVTTLVYMDTN